MQLSIRALTYACASVWGLVVLLVAIGNLLWPPYGAGFLSLVSSIYPGYRAVASLGNVIMGTLYALVDGAVGGAVFAWIYNQAAK
jgi:hypothetical protein